MSDFTRNYFGLLGNFWFAHSRKNMFEGIVLMTFCCGIPIGFFAMEKPLVKDLLAGICMFKATTETLEKGMKYVQI